MQQQQLEQQQKKLHLKQTHLQPPQLQLPQLPQSQPQPQQPQVKDAISAYTENEQLVFVFIKNVIFQGVFFMSSIFSHSRHAKLVVHISKLLCVSCESRELINGLCPTMRILSDVSKD